MSERIGIYIYLIITFLMKKYELVLVVKASMNVDEKTALLNSVEENFEKESILQKDDIGVVKSAYLLEGKKDNTHVHLVSYHLQIEPTTVNALTKKFAFIKGLHRHFFYVMGDNETYITYSDMQKKVQTILDEVK